MIADERGTTERIRTLSTSTEIALRQLSLCCPSRRLKRRRLLLWVMPWTPSDAILSTTELTSASGLVEVTTDSPLRAVRCRRCSPASESTLKGYAFTFLLRQACENNLLQPDLFVDFPLLFLKTHTKELCLVKSHPVPEKVRRRVDPGCFAETLLLLLRVLLIVFRASFA